MRGFVTVERRSLRVADDEENSRKDLALKVASKSETVRWENVCRQISAKVAPFKTW